MASPTRIARLSDWLFHASTALVFGLPLVVATALLTGWADPAGLPLRFPGLPEATRFTASKSAMVTALGAIALLPMLAALWQMRGLFARYRRGEILTDACAGRIGAIGQSLLALAAANFVLPTLQVLALTADNPDGARILSIGIEGNTLGLLLSGGLLIAIGRVMGEAARAAAENESFV